MKGEHVQIDEILQMAYPMADLFPLSAVVEAQTPNRFFANR